MEKVIVPHSLKCIPIPNEDEYMNDLVLKMESFLRRLRWHIIHRDHDDAEKNEGFVIDDNPKYGFKCEYKPRFVEDLEEFEKEFLNIPRIIKFRNVKYDDLQSDLKKFVKNLKQSPDVWVHADKSKNIYKMSVADYRKLLLQNVTAEYCKSTPAVVNNVNKQTQEFASRLNLDDRMEIFTNNEANFLIKDHKEGFPGKMSVRLLNPCKTDLGKISKQIIQQIVSDLNEKIQLNQWRSSQSVLEWFNGIKSKDSLFFVKFDIVSFYPSISRELLMKALNFAKTHVAITTEDINIILHSRKSFLYYQGNPWVKKGQQSMFDVPMGSYDGAEVCELVGLYILHKISVSKLFAKNGFGIYRDDGLGITSMSGRSGEHILRQSLIHLFKNEELDITCEVGAKVTDFLDIELNLSKAAYRPFRKANNQNPLYIDAKSNHPPTVIKQLPNMIQDRISTLSSTEKTFYEVAPIYENSLKNSGFKDVKLIYKSPSSAAKKKGRKRRIVYFNPPWNSMVETNVARIFLRLIDKHFPKTHKLHKFINRNCIKVSYSCTKNIKAHIAAHNKKVLNPRSNDPKGCNCRSDESRIITVNKALNRTRTVKKPLNHPPPNWFSYGCPVNGQCKTESVIYSAKVESNSTTMEYIGLTGDSFKSRYNGHTETFRKNDVKKTTLSSYIHELEEKEVDYGIHWQIKHRATTYKPGANYCGLCNREKVAILLSDPQTTLNKRTELLEMCRHRHKFKLESLKT